ncbi:hypothetical protein [Kribbella sp. NBC_00889]|uniref:hypothetical protein n=1 Tax=Kribbella sp. NBC_00889 TaxID=2975974 RepID=UPI00386E4051|nr:hypothetical protein OG817_29545 [Kribbella sp. NBC_00889]
MSTYPGQAAAPKKTLTWIAIACFAIGAVLTLFFVWRIVETVPESPQSVAGGVVHLKEEGLTIYSSVPVLNPPCEAKDASGGAVPLKAPTGSEQITINDETWYVVARSVDTVPAGDYSISCTDDTTGATYAAGPKSSVVAFVLSIFGAIGSFLIFFILGGVLLTIGAVRNRRRNRPPNTYPPQQPPGAPGNYPPPPGAQNGTFPAPPPYNPGPDPDHPQDR